MAAVGIAAACLAASARAEQVITVQDGDDLIAVEIRSLEIEGQLYDVLFPFTTPNELYGPPNNKTFPFDPPEGPGTTAAEAVGLVNLALTRAGANRVGDGVEDDDRHRTGFRDHGTFILTQMGRHLIAPPRWIDTPAGMESENRHIYADYTLVPLPATLPMLMAACAAVGLLGRRRRADAPRS